MHRTEIGVFLIILLLGMQYLSVNISGAAQTTPVSIWEEYCYQTSFDADSRQYIQNQTSHKIEISGHELVDREHNLTLAMKTNESILSSVPLSIVNYNESDNNYAIILFNGTEFDYVLFLENTRSYPSALNVTITPSDTVLLSADENHFLNIDMLLEASEPLDSLYVQIGSRYSTDIIDYAINSDLNLTGRGLYAGAIEMCFQNIAVGSHKIQTRTSVSNLEGSFPIRFDCHQRRNTTFPIVVLLDGEEIEVNQGVRYYVDFTQIDYLCADIPWVYGLSNPRTYNVTFLSDRTLRIRVDPFSREKIEFLLVQKDVLDFTVEDCVIENCKAYMFNVNLSDSSAITLGITIYDKKWFLRPDIMKIEDIPKSISDQYTCPRPNEYIDSDNDLVKLWKNQVIGNESNPLLIASLLYRNLTSTLDYSESFADFCPANETASATLRYRAGVCRHFSRAFAALASVSSLPVRLVIGTALNLELPVTTLKKNHSWCEAFFPKFGWVPIDITWQKFGVLPNTHALVSFWEYENSSLNISPVDNSQIYQYQQDSVSFLRELVKACRNRTSTVPPDKTEQISLLLNEASLLADNGVSHETLLTLFQAYSLAEQPKKGDTQWFEVAFLFLIISLPVFVVFLAMRKLTRGKNKSGSNNHGKTAKQDFGRSGVY
jgi:hypothetical protein